MRFRNAIFALTLVLPAVQGVASAQALGAVVSGHLEIEGANTSRIHSKIPLPVGPWEVSYSHMRKSYGNYSADLREIYLIQIDEGPPRRLKHALEIVVKVGGPNIRWIDEPCKVASTLGKNDFGTRLYKQKCVTLVPSLFLQNNNDFTRQSLSALALRNVQHDFNALAMRYSRFGDFGYFLTITEYFFPSFYGMENPKVSDLNSSPWSESGVNASTERARLVKAIMDYGEQISSIYDKAYLREDSEPLPAFEYP